MQIEIPELELEYAEQRVRSRARHRTLVGSLLCAGQQVPVLVVRRQGQYVLVDGYARVAALKELARDVVEAVVLETDLVDALVLRHRMNAGRRTPLEDAWLIENLLETHGLTLAEVGLRLQKSKGWVSRCLALVRVLPKTAQEAVKRGLVPAQGARKYLVPLARANALHCSSLVENLGDEPVSVRELERLYIGWRRGDADQRQRLVDNPRLFLKATAELGTEPVAADDVDKLRDHLEGIAGLCARGRRKLRNGVLLTAAENDQLAILNAWQEAQLAYASLASRMAQEERDDRVRCANGNSGTS